MKYQDFSQGQKRYINGVLGKYMDSYVREHLIWTSEQMYHDFIEYLRSFHKKGWYGKQSYKNGVYYFINKEEELWMVSEHAEEFILSRFQKKYEKNLTLARKKGPLVDRVRLGYRWNENLFYDLNYGLYKGSHNYKKTEIVEGESLIPWSIEHVNTELADYDTDLISVLEALSTSPIEKMFYQYWIDNYYKKDILFPAIIPEVCGTRSFFWTEQYDGHYYLKLSDIPFKERRQTHDTKSTNIRFDFLILNWYKQKMLFVELDGHEYHKTVEQRSKDAIKRSIATKYGFQLNVMTGTQINRNLKACFDSIHDFLTID
ncbi:hypothetical protein KZA05_04510 [Bacillus amyloliquefaciens]|uniref:hypothetical protein n=1 Tax=Bacillus velezensis TaxID=492670 RepID=UPI001C762510|nr:hypothetical protein KZA05_04510 [Bacillus amyloliquefaciens]